MNLLMIAPLCDSRGKIRYHIGAQVDVSGLVKDCTDLESLQKLVLRQNQLQPYDSHIPADTQLKGDEFQDLSEMLNIGELDTVRKWGGRMHREYQDDEDDSSRNGPQHMPRLLLKEPVATTSGIYNMSDQGSGRLGGIYQNVGFGLRKVLIGKSANQGLVFAHSALPFAKNSFRFSNTPCSRNSPITLYEQNWWLYTSSR